MTRLFLLMSLPWLLVAANVRAEEKANSRSAKVDQRIFEMRTYYANAGKMQALHARFRDHTCKLFKKHGMELVGFWSPIDPKHADEMMVYILAYPSKTAAETSWKA